MMINTVFLFLCFYILMAIWIYYDATKHNIGKLSDQEEKKLMIAFANGEYAEEKQQDRSILNMTAGAWAFGTMLAGVIGAMIIATGLTPDNTRHHYGWLGIFVMLSIPFLYFWRRPYLLKRAQIAPVVISLFQRTVSLGIFAAMGCFIILVYIKAHQ